LPAGELEEMRRGLVAEATRTEMDADPHPALFVFEQVDIVITGSDCAELLACHLLEVGGAGLVPQRTLEEFVIDLLLVDAAEPETNRARNVTHDLVHRPRDVSENHVGAYRHVAAADIEADTADRHVVLIRNHATNRLGIAEMPVGTQNAGDAAAHAHATL